MTVKKLFIGGLRENVTEDDLKSYFSQYGSILEVVIMKEKDTSKSRGFGFVTFDDYDPIDKIICMISIFKKTFMHAFLRRSQRDMTIIVHQHRFSAEQVLFFRLDVESFKAPVLQHFLFGNLRNHAILRFGPNDLRGRMTMVEQRIIA